MAIVAITGITGLAGSSVAHTLQRSGHRVIGISRRDVISRDGSEMRTVHDLRDADALTMALRGCDTILHFADRADRRTYTESDVDTAGLVIGALRTACDRLGIRRIVAASSVHAERKVHLSDRYVRSKQIMEACALAPTPGAKPIILRLPPLHGHGAKGTVRHIARAIERGWPLPLGLANAPRRFLSLEALGDLCTSMTSLDDARFAATAGMILYPSNSVEASLTTLALSLNKGRRVRLLPIPGIDRLIPGVIPAVQLADEQDRVFRATGWRPKTAKGWAPTQW